MDQQIIDKLGLVPTEKYIGQSFENGVTVYEYKGALVAQCDEYGHPTEYISFYVMEKTTATREDILNVGTNIDAYIFKK